MVKSSHADGEERMKPKKNEHVLQRLKEVGGAYS